MGKGSRRAFVGSVVAGAIGSAAAAWAGGEPEVGQGASLSPDVQMQLMRPGQIEAAGRAFPVVYVPLGTIEWHGPHLPVGCDALKAHGILVKCAEKHGGVVHPPIYFHEGFPREHLVPLLSRLFEQLKRMGFRVILGVSGHNVQGQIDIVDEALKPVKADGSVAGMGLWEVTLSFGPESATDHAAKWETSDMQHFYPAQVDIGKLGTGPITFDMKPPFGIGGEDPRATASAKVGARNVELASDAIGRKARALLETLPPAERGFRNKSIEPGNWWML